MNENLKFRAWDKLQNKMLLPKIFSEDVVIQLGGVVGLFNGKTYDTATKEFEIMQATGLKDKDGQEIYEGDFDEDWQVVMWCENSYGWQWATYDFPTKEKICCHCYNCEGDYNFTEPDEIKICGNIFENAEGRKKNEKENAA